MAHQEASEVDLSDIDNQYDQMSSTEEEDDDLCAYCDKNVIEGRCVFCNEKLCSTCMEKCEGCELNCCLICSYKNEQQSWLCEQCFSK
jgi:hypothetical protein